LCIVLPQEIALAEKDYQIAHHFCQALLNPSMVMHIEVNISPLFSLEGIDCEALVYSDTSL